MAAARGVAVIVNQPFEEGALFRDLGRRPLPAWVAEIGCNSWAQYFLKYILGHPAVTCVIPATASPSHMADDLAAGAGPVPDERQRQRACSGIGRPRQRRTAPLSAAPAEFALAIAKARTARTTRGQGYRIWAKRFTTETRRRTSNT